MAQLSGILVKDQAWSGLPVSASDNTVIRNCNFKNPVHNLAVNTKNSSILLNRTDSNHSMPSKASPPLDQVSSSLSSSSNYSRYCL